MEILSLGEKIKRQRKSLGLTLKDIAGDYTTSAQLSYIESGKCKPSDKLLKYICEKLSLDIEYVAESEALQAERYCEHCMEEYDACARINDMDAAKGKLDMVEKVASDFKLEMYEGIAVYNKGVNEVKNQDFSSAQLNMLAALQTFIKLNNKEFAGESFYHLGIISMKRRYYDEAILYFEEAINAAEPVNDEHKSLFCRTSISLAGAYFMKGEIERAVDILNHIMEKAYTRVNSIENINSIDKIEFLDNLINSVEMDGQRDYKLLARLIMFLDDVFLCAFNAEEYIERFIGKLDSNLSTECIEYLFKTAELLMDHDIKNNVESIIDKAGSCLKDANRNIMYQYLMARFYFSTNPDLSGEYAIQCLKLLEKSEPSYMTAKIRNLLYQLFKGNHCCSRIIKHLTDRVCTTDAKGDPIFEQLLI